MQPLPTGEIHLQRWNLIAKATKIYSSLNAGEYRCSLCIPPAPLIRIYVCSYFTYPPLPSGRGCEVTFSLYASDSHFILSSIPSFHLFAFPLCYRCNPAASAETIFFTSNRITGWNAPGMTYRSHLMYRVKCYCNVFKRQRLPANSASGDKQRN